MAFNSLSSLASDTTLGAAVTTNPTAGTIETWTLASGGGAIVAGFFKPGAAEPTRIGVETEVVEVQGINGDTITVKRGAQGTTTATHANSTKLHVITTANLYALIVAAFVASAPGS